jgi:regulator of protease activity HflC (stomatin/prohibitin superfamily)
MYVLVGDNQVGLLFRNGVYREMLAPGKHRVWKALGDSAEVLSTGEPIDKDRFNLKTMLLDKAFAESVNTVEVADGRLCAHFVDGRINGILNPGSYAFWNVDTEHGFEMIDVSDPHTANEIPDAYVPYVPAGYMETFEVNPGYCGLLYINNIFRDKLDSGRYRYWKRYAEIDVRVVDMREQQFDITGQEILSADRVSLRVNFVASFRVTDPVAITQSYSNYRERIHVLLQRTLREYAGKYRFDELLKQKDNIGDYALEALKEQEKALYVEFTDAGIKDIILPGEVRDIMNTVLVAEKAAQASVITRREETAATKSLLETAKLMEGNAALYKLKELEYMERICEKVGQISVDSGNNVMDSLRKLFS